MKGTVSHNIHTTYTQHTHSIHTAYTQHTQHTHNIHTTHSIHTPRQGKSVIHRPTRSRHDNRIKPLLSKQRVQKDVAVI